MRVDMNFFGTVPMPDAGDPAIAPTARRYGTPDAIACYENMLHWAQTGDALGFDTMWLTEHHFQYEGYEVLPNLIMFGLYAATQIKTIAWWDVVGFNGVANMQSIAAQSAFAIAACILGYVYNKRKGNT